MAGTVQDKKEGSSSSPSFHSIHIYLRAVLAGLTRWFSFHACETTNLQKSISKLHYLSKALDRGKDGASQQRTWRGREKQKSRKGEKDIFLQCQSLSTTCERATWARLVWHCSLNSTVTAKEQKKVTSSSTFHNPLKKKGLSTSSGQFQVLSWAWEDSCDNSVSTYVPHCTESLPWISARTLRMEELLCSCTANETDHKVYKETYNQQILHSVTA